jgi:hypothetical protein
VARILPEAALEEELYQSFLTVRGPAAQGRFAWAIPAYFQITQPGFSVLFTSITIAVARILPEAALEEELYQSFLTVRGPAAQGRFAWAIQAYFQITQPGRSTFLLYKAAPVEELYQSLLMVLGPAAQGRFAWVIQTYFQVTQPGRSTFHLYKNRCDLDVLY